MPIILAFRHAPIFIPWSEVIEIRPRRILLSRCYQMIVKQRRQYR